MNYEEKLKRRKKEKLALVTVTYFLALMFVTRASILVRNGLKISPQTFIEDVIKSFYLKPIILPEKADLKYLLIVTIFFIVWVLNIYSDNKKYMHGEEYGSSTWSKSGEMNKFRDKKKENNIILTETEVLSLDSRKTKRNCNVLVIGGSGTGKTRFYVKPNLMQMHSSYVVTDPKGELFRDTAKMFFEEGYKVKVFDLYEMLKSFKYNPFYYIRKESDILKLVNNLIQNTTPPGKQGGDPFWEKSERALLESLIAFTWLFVKEEEQNFSTILRLMEKIEVREEDEEHESQMDVIMKQYAEKYPGNFAWRQWCIYKQAGGRTAKSINISLAVRLEAFNTQDLSILTSKDELELDKLGDEKTILYILIPDSDSTFNFLVSMLYQQLFETLYYIADFKNNGRLKNSVRCIIDEFANIGQIPEFEKKLSTMRSREISASIIIQNIAQLEALYKDHWKTIIGNCDSMLFLGSNEKNALKYMEEILGKRTIDTKTTGISKGKSGSYSQNFQRTGRDLMTASEIQKMSNEKCILLFRGLNPFFSNKYKIENHLRYKRLYDFSEKNKISFEELTLEKSIVLENWKELKQAKDKEEIEQIIQEYQIRKIA